MGRKDGLCERTLNDLGNSHRCRLLLYRFSVLAPLAIKNIQIWHVSEDYMAEQVAFYRDSEDIAQLLFEAQPSSKDTSV